MGFKNLAFYEGDSTQNHFFDCIGLIVKKVIFRPRAGVRNEGGRIRTPAGMKPLELKSSPFDRSGTPSRCFN